MLIPIIDLGPFMVDEGVVVGQEATQEQIQVAKDIDGACRHHGFVYLTHFGISRALRRQAFGTAQELFALDESTKMTSLLRIHPSHNSGYAPFATERLNRSRPPELKEAFNVRFPRASKSAGKDDDETFDDEKVWMGCSPAFRSVVQDELLPLLKKAAERYALACALALHLPSSFFVQTLQEFNQCTVRFLHGPPCPEVYAVDNTSLPPDDLQIPLRVGEHTDFGAFTFLLWPEGDGSQGFQVKLVEGGEIGGAAGGEAGGWIDLQVPDLHRHDGEGDEDVGAMVNTGALMARWTNDVWKATAHRVIVANADMARRHRYSMAFFVDPDRDALVEVHERFATVTDEEGEGVPQIKYPPITGSEYLALKLREMMTPPT